MKKIALVMVIIVILGVCGVCFAACDNGDDDVLKVEISGFKYGIVKAEEGSTVVPDYDINNINNINTVEVGTFCFMIIEFDVISRANNNGTNEFTTHIYMTNVGVLDGYFEEVGSANTTSSLLPFFDSENNDAKKASAPFKIPDKKDSLYHKKIYIRLDPKMPSTSENQIKISFTSDDATLVGESSDGITKHIQVIKGHLASPDISFDSSTGELRWPAVPNAGSYKIKVNGSFIKDNGYDLVVKSGDPIISVVLSSYGVVGNNKVVVYAIPISGEIGDGYLSSYSAEIVVNN